MPLQHGRAATPALLAHRTSLSSVKKKFGGRTYFIHENFWGHKVKAHKKVDELRELGFKSFATRERIIADEFGWIVWLEV